MRWEIDDVENLLGLDVRIIEELGSKLMSMHVNHDRMPNTFVHMRSMSSVSKIKF
jgi:hypothetical protein